VLGAIRVEKTTVPHPELAASKMIVTSERRRLPNRRTNISIGFEYEGHNYRATAGYFNGGTMLGEIFLHVPGKLGSALQSQAGISAAKQCRHRRDPDQLAPAARRAPRDYSTLDHRPDRDCPREIYGARSINHPPSRGSSSVRETTDAERAK
jgi:hypothetical protein